MWQERRQRRHVAPVCLLVEVWSSLEELVLILLVRKVGYKRSCQSHRDNEVWLIARQTADILGFFLNLINLNLC